jgi:hypothetical protein
MARKSVKPFVDLCGADDAGHLISRELGGKAEEPNLIPQNRQVNFEFDF